jgi:hypothetical protein
VQHRSFFENVKIKGGVRSSAFLMGCSGIFGTAVFAAVHYLADIAYPLRR